MWRHVKDSKSGGDRRYDEDPQKQPGQQCIGYVRYRRTLRCKRKVLNAGGKGKKLR